MSDRQAFVRAIIAHPKDTRARLVFADYLSENGEDDRADFIRLQCEVAAAMDPKTWDRIPLFAPGDRAAANREWHTNRTAKEDHTDRLMRAERDVLHDLHRANRLDLPAVKYHPLTPYLHRNDDGHADDYTASFDRGFARRVTATTHWWCGFRCPPDLVLDGRCMVRRFNSEPTVCRRCGGSGLIPGHGVTLCRMHPVEELVLCNDAPEDVSFFLQTPAATEIFGRQFRTHNTRRLDTMWERLLEPHEHDEFTDIKRRIATKLLAWAKRKAATEETA